MKIHLNDRMEQRRTFRIVTIASAFLTSIYTIQYAIVDLKVQKKALAGELIDLSPAKLGNKDQKRKPYLVFHIGPPKTATTTIQQSLTSSEWNELLTLDNYKYTGSFNVDGQILPALPIHNMLKNVTCHKEMHRLRAYSRHSRRTTTTKTSLLKLSCVDTMLQELKQFLEEGRSLIVSDETISIPRRTSPGQMAPYDWLSLRELLEADWKLLVIVAYRRYIDWLPSAKQQVERWTPSKPAMNRWPNQGGKVIEGLFPDFYKVQPGIGRMPYFFTDQIIFHVKKYLPVTIMNMHSENQSVLTTFLCDSMPSAKHCCSASREKDRNKDIAERKANEAQTLYYDMLAIAASQRGLIQTGDQIPRRHDVVLAAKHHQESQLKKSYRDFPLECPEQKDLDIFLEKSLTIEKRLLPEFYNSPAGETSHKKQFQQSIMENNYCHINTNLVLADTGWKQFFMHIHSLNLTTMETK